MRLLPSNEAAAHFSLLLLIRRLSTSGEYHLPYPALQNTPLANRLRTAVGLRKAEAGKVEIISPGRGLTFPGVIITPPPPDSEEEKRDSKALEKAREHEEDGDAL